MHEGPQQRATPVAAPAVVSRTRPHVAPAPTEAPPAVAALQRRQLAADASGRVEHLAAQAATLQRRAAPASQPVVQRVGFGGLASTLWGWGTNAWALAAAHPWVSIPLGVLSAGGLAYALSQRNRGLARRPGQRDVADLPEDQLWRMFINPKDFREAEESKDPGGLYDSQKSPGFQQSMLRALREELTFSGGHLGRRVDFAEYTRLHDLVTERLQEGTLGEQDTRATARGLSAGENTYVSGNRTYTDRDDPSTIPRDAQWLPPVNFPINDWNRDDTPLADDLLHESIGGTPMVGKGPLNSSVVKAAGGRIDVNYGADQGPVLTQQIFDRYYREVDAARTPDDKLRAIVKAVRAVHVTHAFRDANGRLNVNILLNKFLLEQGFDPTILPREGLGIFGGGFSVDDLAEAVRQGSTAFRKLAESKKER